MLEECSLCDTPLGGQQARQKLRPRLVVFLAEKRLEICSSEQPANQIKNYTEVSSNVQIMPF